MYVRCNYCGKEYWDGVIRIKYHLAGTHREIDPHAQITYDVRDFFINYLGEKQQQKNVIVGHGCLYDQNKGNK